MILTRILWWRVQSQESRAFLDLGWYRNLRIKGSKPRYSIFLKFFFSFIGGRCLAQEHCAGLRNSICQEDSNVKLPNGLPIQTCQCMDGYIDHRFGCEKDDEGFEPGTMSYFNFNRKFPKLFFFQSLIMIFNSSSRWIVVSQQMFRF